MSHEYDKEIQTTEEDGYKLSSESYIQKLINRRLDEETAALMEIKELQYKRLLRHMEENYKNGLKNTKDKTI